MTAENSSQQVPVVRLGVTHALLFIAISAGVAAAAWYFSSDLRSRVEGQAEELTGAKLEIAAQRKTVAQLDRVTRKAIDALPQEQQQLEKQIQQLEGALQQLRDKQDEEEAEVLTDQVQRDQQRARAWELYDLGQDVLGTLDVLAQEQNAHRERVRTIEASPLGRKIASDTDLVELYAGVRAAGPGDAQITKWRKSVSLRLGSLTNPAALQHVELEVEPAVIADLELLRHHVTGAVEELRERRLVLEEIATRAANLQPDDHVAALPLVLKEREQQRAFDMEVAAWQQAEQLASEHIEQLAAARAQTEQARADAAIEFQQHLQQLTEEMSEADQQAVSDAAAEIRQASEQRHAETLATLERRRKESAYQAALPEIRAYLIPFIHDGNTQLRKRYAQYETAAATGPVSLARIAAHGGLDDSPRGHFMLHAMAAGGGNDRPAGRFPPYFGGSSVRPEHVPFMRKAQQLLRDHGEMMVEHGLLAE